MLREVGIVGSGTMGRAISALCLSRGMRVALWSRQPESIVRTRVADILQRYAPDDLDRLENLAVGEDPRILMGVEVVVESIAEDLAAKRAIFATLDQVLPSSVILASNTSVLASAVFMDLSRTRRLKSAGLHFFHPVFRMELVEVNVHSETGADTESILMALVRQIGKSPLRIPDVAGGVVSRLVLVVMNEAARLIDWGLDAHAVDEAMRLGAHHPMGPLALADAVGLDVVLQNLRYLAEMGHDERFQPAACITELVAAGRLGRKTGLGFHSYSK